VLLLGGDVMFLGHNITQLLTFTLPTLISNFPFDKWMTRSLYLHVGAFASFYHRTLWPTCKLTLLGTCPNKWWITDLTILEVLLWSIFLGATSGIEWVSSTIRLPCGNNSIKTQSIGYIIAVAGKFLGIVGQYPCDSKSSRLHVDIFWFCFTHGRFFFYRFILNNR
jgi:hypothetical protein